MIFSDPWLLVAGPLAVLLIVLGLVRLADRRRRLSDFLGGRRAAERLGRGHLHRISVGRMILLGVAALSLAAAAAGPRWDGASERPLEPEPPPPTVVLAIDISASMQADDVRPTRLGRAAEVARELRAELEHGRVALVLFSGTPYVLAPPTDDHDALEYLMDGITPELVNIYDPGSLPSALLREATTLLSPTDSTEDEVSSADPVSPASVTEAGSSDEIGPRSIVLIGDGEAGEPLGAIRDAATAAAEEGIRIHAIGVGTAEGGRMVLPAGYTRKGVAGRGTDGPMVSQLEEASLREMAEIGGGLYAHAGDPAALDRIHRTLAEPVAPPTPEVEGPLWSRFDPATLFIGLALLALLAESVLDLVRARTGAWRPWMGSAPGSTGSARPARARGAS